MIKKIVNVASILLIVSTAYLWYQTSKVYIPDTLHAYALKTNYVIYNDESSFTIMIYLNDSSNILKHVNENNIKLSSSRGIENLELQDVKVGKRQNFQGERYFPYYLTFANFSFSSNQFLSSCDLMIENSKYKLEVNVGTIDYKYKSRNHLNLDYTKYYGVYNDIQQSSTLVGVVVTLVNKTNESLYISAYTGGSLRINSSNITRVNNIGNEDSVYKIVKDYNLKLNANTGYYYLEANSTVEVFIPISYNTLLYATNIGLEFTTGDKTYYMPNMSLKSSVPTISQMSNFQTKGTIK